MAWPWAKWAWLESTLRAMRLGFRTVETCRLGSALHVTSPMAHSTRQVRSMSGAHSDPFGAVTHREHDRATREQIGGSVRVVPGQCRLRSVKQNAPSL